MQPSWQQEHLSKERWAERDRCSVKKFLNIPEGHIWIFSNGKKFVQLQHTILFFPHLVKDFHHAELGVKLVHPRVIAVASSEELQSQRRKPSSQRSSNRRSGNSILDITDISRSTCLSFLPGDKYVGWTIPLTLTCLVSPIVCSAYSDDVILVVRRVYSARERALTRAM